MVWYGVCSGSEDGSVLGSESLAVLLDRKLRDNAGVWCMVYGVRYMVYGVWCRVYSIWCRVYGVWFMEYVIWCMVYA